MTHGIAPPSQQQQQQAQHHHTQLMLAGSQLAGVSIESNSVRVKHWKNSNHIRRKANFPVFCHSTWNPVWCSTLFCLFTGCRISTQTQKVKFCRFYFARHNEIFHWFLVRTRNKNKKNVNKMHFLKLLLCLFFFSFLSLIHSTPGWVVRRGGKKKQYIAILQSVILVWI